ncbi:MAG: transporter substrate-binding domain-containing protein [Limnothrix sp.]
MFRFPRFVFATGVAIASIFMSSLGSPSFGTPLEDIQKRGQINIAVKEAVRPLGFRDAAGELQGLEIDIARQLAVELIGDATAVQLIPTTNQARLQLLLDDEVDLIVAQLGVNSSRERLVDFSAYYYLDGVGFLTRTEGLADLKQISTQRVVVLHYSPAIAALQHHFPFLEMIVANSYAEAFALLEAGDAELFAGSHAVLTGWTQEYPAYRLLPAWLDGNALAIAMPKGRQHQSLYNEIQDIMDKWQESGWLQDRINHWGLP